MSMVKNIIYVLSSNYFLEEKRAKGHTHNQTQS